jgi:hypothetical protein
VQHQPSLEQPDNTVECSGRMTLECECGERLTLLGLKEDWLSEQRTHFNCQCGQILTLANRLDEDIVQEFKQIMQGAFDSQKLDVDAAPLRTALTPVLGQPRGIRQHRKGPESL